MSFVLAFVVGAFVLVVCFHNYFSCVFVLMTASVFYQRPPPPADLLERLRGKDPAHWSTSTPAIAKRSCSNSISPTTSFQEQVAASYEDNCARALVKCFYNGGHGIFVSNKYSNVTAAKSTGFFKDTKLTPDFCVPVHWTNDHSFADPLVVVGANNDKDLVATSERDLETPPQSALSTPEKGISQSSSSPLPEGEEKKASTSSSVVLFEFTQNANLIWQDKKPKMEQLEKYLEYLTEKEVVVSFAGFASTCPAVPQKIMSQKSQMSQFPCVRKLLDEGKLLYLYCDETMVKAASISSSRTSHELRALSEDVRVLKEAFLWQMGVESSSSLLTKTFIENKDGFS